MSSCVDTGINEPPRARSRQPSGANALELAGRCDSLRRSDGWIESYAWTFGEEGQPTGVARVTGCEDGT
jgi:hypothetical protein